MMGSLRATVATTCSAASGLDVDALGGAGGQITEVASSMKAFAAFGYGGGTGTAMPYDEISALMLRLEACGGNGGGAVSALGGNAKGSGSMPIIGLDEHGPSSSSSSGETSRVGVSGTS
jgi:hypothetical protein